MNWCYLLAAQYGAAIGLMVLLEAGRLRDRPADAISVFLGIVMLQCALPAVGLYLALPNVDRLAPTDNPVANFILQNTDWVHGELTFLLFFWFVLTFWVIAGLLAGPPGAPSSFPGRAATVVRQIELRKLPLFVLLVWGLLLTVNLFLDLGDSLPQRYANLVLYRAGHPSVVHTPSREIAFLLIQAWSWLSVLYLLAAPSGRAERVAWWLVLAMSVVFALLSGSRRAIVIPVLLVYFAHVMLTRRWYIGRLALVAVPAMLWIGLGERIIGAIAFGRELNELSLANFAPVTLNASAEAGISVVESLGTISHVELPARWGSDHALSFLRRIPDQALGFNIEFPERIVRVSTAVLATPNELDLPPGMMGQMWLDFRAFGPIAWGAMFGIVVGMLARFQRNVAVTRTSAGVFALVLFLIALPVNSGTLDFNFTQDTILMYLVLALVVRWGGHGTEDRATRELDAVTTIPA